MFAGTNLERNFGNPGQLEEAERLLAASRARNGGGARDLGTPVLQAGF
jgi:hypothetical protein